MECLWALERHLAVSKGISGFSRILTLTGEGGRTATACWDWEQGGGIRRRGRFYWQSIPCMECLWALERHSAVSKKVQAFLECWSSRRRKSFSLSRARSGKNWFGTLSWTVNSGWNAFFPWRKWRMSCNCKVLWLFFCSLHRYTSLPLILLVYGMSRLEVYIWQRSQ